MSKDKEFRVKILESTLDNSMMIQVTKQVGETVFQNRQVYPDWILDKSDLLGIQIRIMKQELRDHINGIT